MCDDFDAIWRIPKSRFAAKLRPNRLRLDPGPVGAYEFYVFFVVYPVNVPQDVYRF